MSHHDGSKSGRRAPKHSVVKGIHKEPSHIGLEKGVHEDKRLHKAFTDHVGELGVKHSKHHVEKSHPMHPEHHMKGCK